MRECPDCEVKDRVMIAGKVFCAGCGTPWQPADPKELDEYNKSLQDGSALAPTQNASPSPVSSDTNQTQAQAVQAPVQTSAAQPQTASTSASTPQPASISVSVPQPQPVSAPVSAAQATQIPASSPPIQAPVTTATPSSATIASSGQPSIATNQNQSPANTMAASEQPALAPQNNAPAQSNLQTAAVNTNPAIPAPVQVATGSAPSPAANNLPASTPVQAPVTPVSPLDQNSNSIPASRPSTQEAMAPVTAPLGPNLPQPEILKVDNSTGVSTESINVPSSVVSSNASIDQESTSVIAGTSPQPNSTNTQPISVQKDRSIVSDATANAQTLATDVSPVKDRPIAPTVIPSTQDPATADIPIVEKSDKASMNNDNARPVPSSVNVRSITDRLDAVSAINKSSAINKFQSAPNATLSPAQAPAQDVARPSHVDQKSTPVKSTTNAVVQSTADVKNDDSTDKAFGKPVIDQKITDSIDQLSSSSIDKNEVTPEVQAQSTSQSSDLDNLASSQAPSDDNTSKDIDTDELKVNVGAEITDIEAKSDNVLSDNQFSELENINKNAPVINPPYDYIDTSEDAISSPRDYVQKSDKQNNSEALQTDIHEESNIESSDKVIKPSKNELDLSGGGAVSGAKNLADISNATSKVDSPLNSLHESSTHEKAIEPQALSSDPIDRLSNLTDSTFKPKGNGPIDLSALPPTEKADATTTVAGLTMSKDAAMKLALDADSTGQSGENVIGKTFKPSSVALTIVGLMLIGAYIWQVNYPNLALKVAGNRANIAVSLPDYLPNGWKMSGAIQSKPGLVSYNLSNEKEDREVSVTTAKTDWDSQALADNYVSSKVDNYLALQSQGLTIYVYGDNQASWVNNGKWYRIEGNSSGLSQDQVVKMATTL